MFIKTLTTCSKFYIFLIIKYVILLNSSLLGVKYIPRKRKLDLLLRFICINFCLLIFTCLPIKFFLLLTFKCYPIKFLILTFKSLPLNSFFSISLLSPPSLLTSYAPGHCLSQVIQTTRSLFCSLSCSAGVTWNDS